MTPKTTNKGNTSTGRNAGETKAIKDEPANQNHEMNEEKYAKNSN